MHGAARFFGGILLGAALVAAGAFIFYTYQKYETRSGLEARLESLESKLSQEVAVRQALAAAGESQGFLRSGSSAPAPGPAPNQERDWRQEMERKDKQIAYLRSVVEKMAFQTSPAPVQAPIAVQTPNVVQAPLSITPTFGSPQTALEVMPRPLHPSPAASLSPANQILGEISQASPEYNLMFINRGERHGVTSGMTFEVYRKGRPIGSVKVGTVYDAVSSVTVFEGSESFQPGDMVRSAEI